jgi:alpha-1,6-mannosyltransferase
VSLSTLLKLAPVAACLALGALAARLTLRSAPAPAGAGLAQPLAVVTAWDGLGVTLFALLAGSLGLAAVLLAAALLHLATHPKPGGAVTIVASAALALAVCLAWPVVFSSDTYAYAAYGDLALHGLDPYRAVPAGFHDPYVDAARWQWGGTFPLCVYGPAFVALASFGVTLSGGHGVGSTLLGLRLLAALAFLASTAALHAALEGLTPGRRFTATCAYALNPVALWSVAEGHNDALALLCVLGGAALARRARPLLGGLALGFSALLKAPGPLLGLALALDAGLPPRLRGRLALALAAASALALSLALPWQWPALTAVGTHGHYAPVGSLQGLIGLVPGLAIALGLALGGAWRLSRGESDGYAWLGLGAWLAIPTPYPWYVLWVLPAVSAAPDSRAGAALWAVTILAVLRYLPDAAGNMAYDPRFLALAALAPLLILLVPVPARFSDMKVAAHP